MGVVFTMFLLSWVVGSRSFLAKLSLQVLVPWAVIRFPTLLQADCQHDARASLDAHYRCQPVLPSNPCGRGLGLDAPTCLAGLTPAAIKKNNKKKT